jgi:hypothetical protein
MQVLMREDLSAIPKLCRPPNVNAKHVSPSADALLQIQKLTWGAVQGENMMNHNRAATSKLKMSLLVSCFLSKLGSLTAVFMIA